jgi:hypothetical protein
MPAMSEERKPLWPWIVALLIGLPVVYVASFGPACKLVRRDVLRGGDVAHFYRPIVENASTGPAWLRQAAEWYSGPAIQHSYTLDELLFWLQYEELERQARQRSRVRRPAM